jgi:anti-sigma B factor antagonist
VDFDVDSQPTADRTVIAVTGDLDVLTAPRLRDELIEAIDSGQRNLYIDLTGCEFLDSSGLSALVTGLKRVRSLGGDLALICPVGNVRRLIEVVALDQVFTLHTGLDPQ